MEDTNNGIKWSRMSSVDINLNDDQIKDISDMFYDVLEYSKSESTILQDSKAKEICEMVDKVIKGYEPFDLTKLGESFKKEWFSPLWKKQREPCTYHNLYQKLKGSLDLYDKEGANAILEFAIGVYMDGASDQLFRDSERVSRAIRARCLDKGDTNEHN